MVAGRGSRCVARIVIHQGGSTVQVPKTGELLSLSGKVAIVTGASQGIGAGIARRLAEAGAAVAVHYRSNADEAARVVAAIVAKGGTATSVQADLFDAAAAKHVVAQTVACFDRVDILVNNAGMFPTRPLLEMKPGEWRDMYESVLVTTVLCTQAAAETMKSAGDGAIVNIASIGAIHPAPDHSHYNSAKAAVVMFTRSAALELGQYGIRVNAVSPGLIARPGIEERWPEGVARWNAKVLLGRLGEPEDVADACLFLASPAARWITGHNLVVDGGVTASAIY
jgi:NAD(P)-dependent dehydrogenase (short-subunit alcohol dehydrogenase family)